jgi:hypothetical protein
MMSTLFAGIVVLCETSLLGAVLITTEQIC